MYFIDNNVHYAIDNKAWFFYVMYIGQVFFTNIQHKPKMIFFQKHQKLIETN